ncbi:hypothetical protein CRI94_07700 [Longibacter salinarum]|uniref:Carboxypeptidase regulatory-like domain-containing protein n=1 Tax=Longibacter salinarum TaxID=1850348 RepID=A0A2A8CZ80_9BACT|nr:carboxypeptidase-like regulatory domain-containing protein [Longibacter salinarum]PEN13930.1 hypothetical protein CRI94_07700 [Longibacter salinarum]
MPDRLSFLYTSLASLLIGWLTIGALAQSAVGQGATDVTLTGIVVDRATGSPLPGAHVFIAQSMNGTTTGLDGRFTLNDVRRGAKRLYASMLGYEPQHVDLFLREDTTLTFAFRLPPRVIESPGVLVEAERDPEWHKRLERFQRLFLGSSEWASECRIQNPEVLRFTSRWWGKFTAQAAEPLVIENRALGYRVKYFLEEFEASGGVIRWDGEPLFAPITASSIEEADRWRTNRRQAYLGSFRHFLRALLDDRLEEEDFEIYRLPRASMFSSPHRADRFHADRDDILSVNGNNVTELDFHGRLEVVYRGEPESRNYRAWRREMRAPSRVQTSLIELNDPPVRVDRHGKIVEPYGATVYQYFAFERLAELIPLDYEPGKEVTYVGIDAETDVHLQTLPPPDLKHLQPRN